MTTKEKIILESIKRLEKEHAELMKLWNATPLQDIYALRIEFQNNFSEYTNGTPESMSMISEMAKEEKRLFKLAEKQQKATMGMSNNRIRIERELDDLKRELYYIEQKI